jgi:hypothetical protein
MSFQGTAIPSRPLPSVEGRPSKDLTGRQLDASTMDSVDANRTLAIPPQNRRLVPIPPKNANGVPHRARVTLIRRS